MTHPSEQALALHAGGDLGWIEAISVGWHLRGCEHCRAEIAALKEGMGAARAEALELPEFVNWTRLSGQMQGNINVGVEASRAISGFRKREARVTFDWRPAVAMAAIVLVALMGWYLSFSRAERINNPAVLLEARAGGIEWKQGQTTMTMMQRGDEKASFTIVDMKGSASSRYVDAETGQVAITNVYVD